MYADSCALGSVAVLVRDVEEQEEVGAEGWADARCFDLGVINVGGSTWPHVLARTEACPMGSRERGSRVGAVFGTAERVDEEDGEGAGVEGGQAPARGRGAPDEGTTLRPPAKCQPQVADDMSAWREPKDEF